MEKPNLSYIKELSGGNLQFEAQLIGVIKKEWPEEIALYQHNIQKEAFAKAAENVHKIKHKFGIVGLEEAYDMAITYEAQLKQEQLGLRSEFEKVLQLVTHFISEL